MSYSFISTDATRDELAEKEAEEFDFNYAYVFGSQARYKKDNCNGHYGTVIASYNIEYGGEVANVVFVSAERPLYVIPSSFFRLTRELQRLFTSNNQRRKRQENFPLMDCVQLGVDEHNRVLWVTKASRHHSRLELFSDGFIGIFATGVIRPQTKGEDGGVQQEKRLWVEKLGWVDDLPPEVISDVLTDVSYKVQLHLITQPDLLDEKNLQPESLRMGSFEPEFQFQLYDFLAVDDVHQDIVETMEWNAPRVDYRMDDSQDSDVQWAFGLESDKSRVERSKTIKDVLCLTITDAELYAPKFAHDRTVMVKVPWMNYWKAPLPPGTFVDVSLVYNKWNNWYIVADDVHQDYPRKSSFRPLSHLIVPTGQEKKKITKLLVEIEATDLEQYYGHYGQTSIGLLFDRDRLLDRAAVMNSECKRVVWVVHEQGAGTENIVCNFVIHSIPTPEEMMQLVLMG